MNAAVFARTFKDQARIRTYIFLLLLMAMGFMAGWGPITAFDAWAGDPDPGLAEERGKLDGAFSLAVLFALPILNVKMVLLVFAVLTSVSATATEWQERTMFLLFSKPVPRWRIVLAKIFGAYAWVVIGLVALAVALLIGAAVGGMDHLRPGQFFGGLAWIVLASFPLVVVSAAVGVTLRKSIPAVFLSLLLLGLLAPVLGQAGFFIAMQDEDFKNEGIYRDIHYQAADLCYQETQPSSDALYRAETQEELDEAWVIVQAQFKEVDECRTEAVGEVDSFYTSRGVSPMQMGYDWDWCRAEVFYETWSGGGPEDHQVYDRCWGREDGSYRNRSAALASKFERPLADAPRFLSPTTVMAAWQPVSGWTADDAPRLVADFVQAGSVMEVFYGENGVGASATPRSVAGSVVGLVLHGVFWPLVAAWAINRRDLS